MSRWAILFMLASCHSGPAGPYETPPEVARSTVEAEALSRRGADLIATDPEEAERLLRAALSKDIFYGPAHNNLGVVYLKQKKLYEAASEFEWARKLLPGTPDPRINLALTLEMAGRTDEALRAYEAALEVEPECIAAMQGAASLVTRRGSDDARLSGWFDRIAMRGENEAWREWARMQGSQ